ncbi:MAG: hypothetical protein GAK35_02903 [Herbaspirillum frisingense]|uniref:Uncharacterized protein n=1 Tax=Herbaspirillum frisingense TaxID=92645 RepID=A0A7V8JTD7_9BURK|nr:MAG: hypothetical protein GAK35_02903 [Herbaspirillum frisingense]
MHILDQIMSWGMVFVSWYAVYVLVAGGAFAAYLVYRLWLPDALKPKHGRHQPPQHRRVD